MEDHVETLRRYLSALEGFAPRAELESFFTPDAVQQEYPNRLFAEGRKNDLSTMMSAYDKGAELLSSQKYVLRNTVAEGDQVAAEIEWTGTLRTGFGSLAAGATLRASLGMFFTFVGSRIASIKNYDCYYPF
jgi:predicted ester cyclase